MKDLTWLLFYVSPDLEFQFGRANAVSGRIHRMLKLGHWSIDDDDEELGDDADQGLGRRAPGKRTSNSAHASNCFTFGALLRDCTSFTRCSAAGAATRLELRGFLRASCVRHRGRRDADAGSQSQVLGPLPTSLQVVDMHRL